MTSSSNYVAELARISAAAKAAAAAAQHADAAAAELHAAVAEAREAGITWAAIAAVLDITRQAAWKRFGKNH
jgi:predicted ATPase